MTRAQPPKHASEDPNASDTTASPHLARYTRIMVVIVVVLGILLLVAFAVVVGTIMKRMAGGTPDDRLDDAPAIRSSVPMMTPSIGGQDILLDLPEGTEVAMVTVSQGLIIVQIGRKGTSRLSDIMSFDARTGQRLAHIRVPQN